MRELKSKLLKKKTIIIFISLMTLSILLSGYYYNRYLAKSIIASKQKELNLISMSLASHIRDWFKEEMRDAEYLSKDVITIKLIENWIDHPSEKLKEDIVKAFLSDLNVHEMLHVFMVLPDKSVPIAVPELNSLPDSTLYASIERSLINGKVTTTDFYQCIADSNLYIDFVAPVYREDGRHLAFLVYRFTPEIHLLAILNNWPVSTHTGTAKIIYQANNSARIFPGLYSIGNGSAELKNLSEETNLENVVANLSNEGLIEFTDHRGKRVIAFLGQIKETPWSLITKIDRDEVFQEMSARTLVVKLLFILLSICFVLIVTWLYYRNKSLVYHDILLKKNELIALQDEFKFIFNSITDAVIVTDKDDKISKMNPAAEQLTGWHEEEAIGKILSEVYTTSDKESLNKKDGSLIKMGDNITSNYFGEGRSWLQTKGGEKISIVERCNLLSDDALRNPGKVITFWDSTEHEQYVFDLLRSREVLEDAINQKDRLISIIAHDIKGPLAGMIGLSELMKNDAAGLPVIEIEQYSGAIHSSAVSVHELLESLLKWARARQGFSQIMPVAFSPGWLVSEVFLLIKESSRQKSLHLFNKIPENIHISADKEITRTVLRNLVSNSIKYSFAGGAIHVFGSVINQNSGTFFRFAVKDNGVGISREALNSIFSLGKIHSNEGTNKEKGSGFGLILCREFVEKQGGRLWVESEPGKETTFYFTIPITDN